ncbi:MAG: Flp pilus assembly protein CpaB [Planctomycetes bacterium]|nr:Flp pilus assembly protein CpaB [Planctomycetota bacterium]
MKSKNMTLMVVAIGCGLVAAFLTARLSGSNAPDMVDVIVAKKELPVGTVLEEKELENLLTTTKMPKGNLPPDIITSADDLKGKRVNRTLKPGNYFAVTDVGLDAGIKLPEGKIKYAIKIDGVKAVAGFVQPGDQVDVILTESTSNGKAASGYVLRDQLVLAVDTSSRRREGSQEAVLQVNSVSLAVSPKEALYLSAAEKRGEVKLTLRDQHSKDNEKVGVINRIPGIDEDAKAQAPVTQVRTTSVIIAKTDVPVNSLIDQKNFDQFFITKEVPAEAVTEKALRNAADLHGKFVVQKIHADMHVFGGFLGNERVDLEPKVVVAAPKPEKLEELPSPREFVPEKPLYPRKFVQIINNQRVWFLETSAGEFRRIDGNGDELKDLPSTGTIEKKPESADEGKPVRSI